METMSAGNGVWEHTESGGVVVDENHYEVVCGYLKSKFPRVSFDTIYEAAHLGISEWYTGAPHHVQTCPKKSRGWMIQVAQRSLSRELRRVRRFEDLPMQERSDDDIWQQTVMRMLCRDDQSFIVDSLTIEKLFAALAPPVAESMRLHVLEDYTVDEVAQLQFCSRDTVKKRLKQGYARLRKVVRQDECSW